MFSSYGNSFDPVKMFLPGSSLLCWFRCFRPRAHDRRDQQDEGKDNLNAGRGVSFLLVGDGYTCTLRSIPSLGDFQPSSPLLRGIGHHRHEKQGTDRDWVNCSCRFHVPRKIGKTPDVFSSSALISIITAVNICFN